MLSSLAFLVLFIFVGVKCASPSHLGIPVEIVMCFDCWCGVGVGVGGGGQSTDPLVLLSVLLRCFRHTVGRRLREALA
jgi:hypothetical protein